MANKVQKMFYLTHKIYIILFENIKCHVNNTLKYNFKHELNLLMTQFLN